DPGTRLEGGVRGCEIEIDRHAVDCDEAGTLACLGAQQRRVLGRHLTDPMRWTGYAPRNPGRSLGVHRGAELRGVQARKGAAGREELVMVALLDDAAFLHDEDEVGVAD